MIRITDQYFWNFAFLLFFVSLVVMGSIILETESRIAYFEVTLIDAVLMSLATYRLTKLFVSDSSTKWFREQFYTASVGKDGVTLHKPTSGPKRTMSDLVSSEWSVGLFMGALISFVYMLTTYAVFPVVLLAVSGLASLVSVYNNKSDRRF